jgi:transcriptional regulator with XRE-family HTH domain
MSVLREIRHARDLSQLEVAAIAGVSLATVRRIEKGQIDTLYLRTLVQVAHALGVAPSDLVPGLDCAPARPRGKRLRGP